MTTKETTETIRQKVAEAKRIVGIQPKVGRRTSGEESPTIVYIAGQNGDSPLTYKLKQGEIDEFDLVVGCCYIVGGKMRDVKPGEDLSWVRPHHIVKDDPKKAQKAGRDLEPDRIPVAYDGLKPGDVVAMPLGGMGREMTCAIQQLGEKQGFSIFVIPPIILKDKKQAAAEKAETAGEAKSEDAEEAKTEEAAGTAKLSDAKLLVDLIKAEPELFRPVYVKDLQTIKLALANRRRVNVMQTRVACGNQVRSNTRFTLFCTDQGGYPQGGFEKALKEQTVNDEVVQALERKENKLTKEIDELLSGMPIYEVLSRVRGMGPLISVAILADIGDIGRFATPGKLRKYVGLSVASDGHFPTKMNGDQATWGDKRQPYYRFADMCNYFPSGFWGGLLRQFKKEYQDKHPQPVLYYNDETGQRHVLIVQGRWKYNKIAKTYTVQVDGQKLKVESKYKKNSRHMADLRYTLSHLHDMSRWKTLQKFADWLWWKWRTLEGHPTCRLPKYYPPEDEAEIQKQKQARATQAQAQAEAAKEQEAKSTAGTARAQAETPAPAQPAAPAALIAASAPPAD